MELNADFNSLTPTTHGDEDDRKSDKFKNNHPVNQTLREPLSEKVNNLTPSIQDPHAFPDGGFQAWFCIAGGFCTIFSSFGWVNCTMPIF